MSDALSANPAPDALPATRPNRWWRLSWRTCCIVLGIYVLLAMLCYLAQDRLIFPGGQTQGQPVSRLPALNKDVVNLTTKDGIEIVAYYGSALLPNGRPDPIAAARPTVIFFYGNAMCLSQSIGLASDFRRLGMNVLVPEYVGYGMSKGQPSEEGCYATADAAYDYLLTRPDVDGHRIVAVGWSLGGAVAIDLASRKPCAAVASLCSFTCILDMTRLPVLPWLVRSRFENERKLGEVRCPVLIAHGRKDSVVPYEMSDRLAIAVKKAPLTRISIDADHNDFFEVGDRKLLEDFRQFVEAATAK